MKVAYRDTESFLKNPPPTIAAILVYGPDYGLMKERAEALGKTVVEDLNDPFNVSVLSEDDIATDPAKLSDEANAVSMMGGRRLVRITNGGDKIEPALKAYLASPNSETLIIIEARELSPRSKLRKLCETAKNAAALACYVEEERDLNRIIGDIFRHQNMPQPNRDALLWLSESLKGDRRRVRNEIEKLILYKGKDSSPVTLEEAMIACGDGGVRSLEDLCYATTLSQTTQAVKILDALQNDGVEFMTILRTLQNHYKKLLFVKQLIAQGQSQLEAKKKLSPPLFFKVEKLFDASLSNWSEGYLTTMLQKLLDIESQSKQTGYEPFVLLGQFIVGATLRKSA